MVKVARGSSANLRVGQEVLAIGNPCLESTSKGFWVKLIYDTLRGQQGDYTQPPGVESGRLEFVAKTLNLIGWAGRGFGRNMHVRCDDCQQRCIDM